MHLELWHIFVFYVVNILFFIYIVLCILYIISISILRWSYFFLLSDNKVSRLSDSIIMIVFLSFIINAAEE